VNTPFTVLEYEDAEGRSEFREWRMGLRRSNPRAAAKVDLLLGMLMQKGTELRFPMVSHIKGPIYELRGRSGRNAVRVYYWRQEKTVFIAASGEVKQHGRADNRLIAEALEAYREFNQG
jgi:putative component of toxin-antitoxin plasmid stabilization module